MKSTMQDYDVTITVRVTATDVNHAKRQAVELMAGVPVSAVIDVIPSDAT